MSFEGFCAVLESFENEYRDSAVVFEFNRFEYILIEKDYHWREVVKPFSDSSSYYEMTSDISAAPLRWRHVVVRPRTVSPWWQRFHT